MTKRKQPISIKSNKAWNLTYFFIHSHTFFPYLERLQMNVIIWCSLAESLWTTCPHPWSAFPCHLDESPCFCEGSFHRSYQCLHQICSREETNGELTCRKATSLVGMATETTLEQYPYTTVKTKMLLLS